MIKKNENRGDLRQLLNDFSVRLQNSPASILNDALKTFYHVYVHTVYSNVLRRNTRFKNKFSKKDRCFVVSNGPSLAKQDLSLLADEHVIVANLFYKHELFHEISPEYYFFVSPLAFTDEKFSRIFRELDEALTETRGKTKLFLPLNQINFCVKNHLFEKVDVYYLLPSLSLKHGIRKIDLTGPIPGLNSGPFGMVLGYYMGFGNMFLIGCDCNFAAHPATYGTHFYSEDYRCFLSYERILKNTLEVFGEYRILNNFLASKGCRVYNATHGGFLDVFPRVKYKQLFK